MSQTDKKKRKTVNSSCDDVSPIASGSSSSIAESSCCSSSSANYEQQQRICCVGMCVLDIIHVCANYPVEDTDKRCLAGHMQRGGNASNMCTVLRSLGCDNVEFLGMTSTATGFEFLRNDMKLRNIIYENCPNVQQNPAFSSVILVENKDSRTIVHSNSNFPIFKYEHFKKLNLENYRWFHFEARNPTETQLMQYEIRSFNSNTGGAAARKTIKISVELEKLFEENLILALAADYVFLGKELARHRGWHDAQEAIHGLRKWIEDARKKKANVEWWQKESKPFIICPWGASGVGFLNENGEYKFITAKPLEKIIDALGAGDTFCAATIYAVGALLFNLEDAVNYGNSVAAAKLGQYGYDGLESKLI